MALSSALKHLPALLGRSLQLFTAAMVLICLSGATAINAQELKCEVEVNSSQVEGTSQELFKTLQTAMTEYLNTNTFSKAHFSPNEKIECKLFLTVKEVNDDKISGDLQIQSSRPVYNSEYTTTLFNFKDNKIEFSYRENDPLVFNTENWESQLTGILNYYAYLILAIDFDSFSPQGGTPYFDVVSKIVQQGQSSGETGWKAFEDNRNRAAVLSAFTDPNSAPMRDLIYRYHRKGLDQMSVSPDKGRAAITEAVLEDLQKLFQSQPMSVGISIFKDTKLDELVNVYSKSPQEERTKVYNLLNTVYPTENERTEKIKNPPVK